MMSAPPMGERPERHLELGVGLPYPLADRRLSLSRREASQRHIMPRRQHSHFNAA